MKLNAFLILLLLVVAACNQKPAPNPGNDSLVVTHPAYPSVQTPNPLDPLDISPMDMSYFPANYPQLHMTGQAKTPPILRVIYSRPHLQGRALFHGLLKYGEIWRLGANEATELDVFQQVLIQDKKFEPGRYTMYCIPEEDHWTIALNGNLDTWGLMTDTTKDILRVSVPVTDGNPFLEYFTIVFEKTAQGADLVMGWGELVARLPVKIPI